MSVWSSTPLAAAAGPEADAWFSAYLGGPVRLVYLDDPTRRPVDPQYGRDGDVVTFADGETPVPMPRFRPSVVVAGAHPRPHRHRRVVPGGRPSRVAGRPVWLAVPGD